MQANYIYRASNALPKFCNKTSNKLGQRYFLGTPSPDRSRMAQSFAEVVDLILSVKSLHLIGYRFEPPTASGQIPLFALDEISSLALWSCNDWDTTGSLPSPTTVVTKSFVPRLQSFALRQERCTSPFQSILILFLQGIPGLQNLHVLLEGTGAFIKPDCFLTSHGATLKTLV